MAANTSSATETNTDKASLRMRRPPSRTQLVRGTVDSGRRREKCWRAQFRKSPTRRRPGPVRASWLEAMVPSAGSGDRSPGAVKWVST